MLKNRVVPPGVTSLVEEDRAKPEYVVKSFMVVAVRAFRHCPFVHPFKSSKREQTVDKGA